MARLSRNAHDTGAGVLAASAADVHFLSFFFLGFFGAIHAALDKLSY